ncbi:MAG: nucleotide exchange factor GrpE [Spirochaetes bacterium]|nr:nucleotide exchange factor GrpE [Spirochaetota bacterium]
MDKHKRHQHEDAAAKADESPNAAAGAKEPAAGENATRLKEELQSVQEEIQECREASAAMEDESAKREEEYQKLKAEMESLKDLMQRRQADFENYKKRQVKMQQEQQKMAVKDLALDIITINDDLLRAIESASNIEGDSPGEEAKESFRQGVDLISKRIVETLNKYGIIEIDSMNQAFDPNYNEAVEIDMSSDVTIDTITKVYLKGFRIDEIVIRPARVRVTRPMKEQENAVGGQKGGEDGGAAPGGSTGDAVKENSG